MTWVNRLKTVIGERSQKDFADWIGESPKRLNNYLLENNEYPAADFLIGLARRGININWLLTGEGDVYIKSGKQYESTEEMQILVRELSEAPAMIPRVTDIVRRAKDVKKADDEVQSAFEGLKHAIGKKPKRPHNPSP